MARSIQEIYNEGVAEKAALSSLSALQPDIDSSQVLLADLTSTSKVAIWRLKIWIMSFMIYFHELLWDEYTSDIQALSNQIITGTNLWYRSQVLLFQYGDSISWNGAQYVYDPVDVNNQIVKRAAVLEIGGQVRIKVAKLDGSGTPIPLDTPEQDALEAYLAQIKFAGTNVAVVNRVADELKFTLNVYYDPLVMNSNGSLISDGTFPVVEAIESFISDLPFNGQLQIAAFVDAIQASQGVVSPYLTSMQARATPDSFQAVNDFYLAEAGYLTIDPLTPIADMITYTPYV